VIANDSRRESLESFPMISFCSRENLSKRLYLSSQNILQSVVRRPIIAYSELNLENTDMPRTC
jgi:hypothetical protein